MTTVLVVDDEPLICRLFSEFLSRQGYKVRTARNGEEALALVEQELPQVVVLDCDMPGMNGVEVLSRLRTRKYAGAALIVTGRPDTTMLERARALGVVDVMSKPVELAKLDLAVHAGLPQKNAEREG